MAQNESSTYWQNTETVFFFSQLQIGSYYGSEVCGLDVDQDGITDLLLVAAPMYLGSGNKEAGRVYIYSFTGVRQLWHLFFSIGIVHLFIWCCASYCCLLMQYCQYKAFPSLILPQGGGVCAQRNSDI